MCIRDRAESTNTVEASMSKGRQGYRFLMFFVAKAFPNDKACLLYTSDAADERSSVDLGGRRIIKKKKNISNRRVSSTNNTNNIT